MARTSPFDLNQRDLFIRSYAEKSVGANETLRQLRDAGFSMGRSAFLDAYRTYAGITKKENSIKYTPNKYRIAPENYTEAKGFISTKYRYTIAYETISKATGEVFTRYTRISTDIERTFGQIKQEAEQIIKQLEYWQGETSSRYWVKSAEIKPA